MTPSRHRGTAGQSLPPDPASARPPVSAGPAALGRRGVGLTGPPAAALQWVLPALGLACALVAGALNAADLIFGRRPATAGMAWSVAYLAVWLAYAVQAGRSRSSRPLRWAAMFWAVVVGGTILCGALLRLNLGTGAAMPGGWVAPALLVVSAAPLYGLVGLSGVEPLLAMLGVAMGAATLTLSLALAAHRFRPSPALAG